MWKTIYRCGCQMKKDKQAISTNHYYIEVENKPQQQSLSFRKRFHFIPKSAQPLHFLFQESLSPIAQPCHLKVRVQLSHRTSYSTPQKDTPGEDLHSSFPRAPSMNSENKGFRIVRSINHLPPELGEHNHLSFTTET